MFSDCKWLAFNVVIWRCFCFLISGFRASHPCRDFHSAQQHPTKPSSPLPGRTPFLTFNPSIDDQFYLPTKQYFGRYFQNTPAIELPFSNQVYPQFTEVNRQVGQPKNAILSIPNLNCLLPNHFWQQACQIFPAGLLLKYIFRE